MSEDWYEVEQQCRECIKRFPEGYCESFTTCDIRIPQIWRRCGKHCDGDSERAKLGIWMFTDER